MQLLSHFSTSSSTSNKIKDEKDVQLYVNTGPQIWHWQSTHRSVIISNNEREVVFHPTYSSGTACVMGSEKLKPNMHYFWEMQITSCLYGTDVIFGVGAKRIIELEHTQYQFLSLLGSTNDSWGLSYYGDILHDGLAWDYASPFTYGTLIGIHVDMCTGTIEFYINRKPLGIAFNNLRKTNCDLYPMITSTAAKSMVRMTCSLELSSSLQIECLKAISRDRNMTRQYNEIEGLKRYYSKFLFWIIPDINAKNIKPHEQRERKKSHRVISFSQELNNNYDLVVLGSENFYM